MVICRLAIFIGVVFNDTQWNGGDGEAFSVAPVSQWVRNFSKRISRESNHLPISPMLGIP